MSESVPPPIPPPVAPPPGPPPGNPYQGWTSPPPPSPRSGLKTLFIVLGICLVFGVVIIGGIGYWAVNQTKKVITPPANSGHPIVARTMEDGWVEARFPEFPLTVSLPSKPTLIPYESEALGEELKIIADHFVSYNCSSFKVTAVILGYWMNFVGMLSIDDQAIREFATSFSTDRGDTKIIELPGLPKGVLATYYKSKEDGRDVHNVNLFRKHDKGIVVICLTALEESEAKAAATKVGSSIRLF